MQHVVLDTECYENYFLATFSFESGEVLEFEMRDDRPNMDLNTLGRRIMQHGFTFVTFNGWRYDMPILSVALAGFDNATLKKVSDRIINDNIMPWVLEREVGFTALQVDHIDLINLLPLFESLKLYGGRNGTAKLQDLPFDPGAIINADMAADLRLYCRNDCNLTWELFVTLWPQIQLRVALGQQYDQDLRSKSDAQIAEAVMKSEYQRIEGKPLIKPIDAGELPTEVIYRVPEWVKFSDDGLQNLLESLNHELFEISDKGKPLAPDWLKGHTVTIDRREYAVGLGGLHAKNKSESYFSGRQGNLIDLDVTSYYPSIILNEGYEPPHMKGSFTQIYKKLVDQRIAAKQSGDTVTADGMKITINGTFGKLGSRYSAVYAPELLLAVTFTGQLALLMLIEMMALRGIQCVSANTDGITVLSKDETLTGRVVAEWEEITGFNMEYTYYNSIHYRDVNNYFAITTDGKVKTKGIFRPPALNKNPTAPIVAQALMRYVLDGVGIEETVYQCNEIAPFLSLRTVRGGAVKDGEYLGKAVRWYYGKDERSAIHYVTNGNKVAKTDGAVPMMNVSGLIPDDLDYQWYVDEATKMIDEVGYFAWI